MNSIIAHLKLGNWYWYVSSLFFIGMALLYSYHLATGWIPPRAAVTLGFYPIYWSAILTLIGILMGFCVMATLAPRRQLNPTDVWQGLGWMLVLGFVGARLYHLVAPAPSMAQYGLDSFWSYWQKPMLAFFVRQGGLGVWGAIIGGACGLGVYCYRYGVSFWPWLDLASIGGALGFSIGRWGHFFSQDIYGWPTTVPWAMTIAPANTLLYFEHWSTVHPVFLYESLWCFLIFALLITLWHRGQPTGDMWLLFMVLYACGRILSESVRSDTRLLTIGPFVNPVASWVGLAVIIMTIFSWCYLAYYRQNDKGF